MELSGFIIHFIFIGCCYQQPYFLISGSVHLHNRNCRRIRGHRSHHRNCRIRNRIRLHRSSSTPAVFTTQPS